MNGHEMKVLPDSCRIRKMFDFERLSWQQATDVKKISRRRNGLFSFGYRARARFISPFMQNERYSVKRGKQSHEANVNWLGTHNINTFPVVRKNTHLTLREKNIFLGLGSGKLTMLIQGVLYSKGRLCCVLQGGITSVFVYS